jgi:hypothetical protein
MPGYGSGALVSAWSLLIRRQQRARRQAETPLIVLCRFPGPALVAFLLIRRAIRSNALNTIFLHNAAKWAFLASVSIWLAGGIWTSILIRQGGDVITLINLHSIIVDGFGSLSIALGIELVARWIWLKRKKFSGGEKWPRFSLPQLLDIDQRGESATKSGVASGVSEGGRDLGERWDALVRYDDDVVKAAEILKPFGDQWVRALGRAFLALNEDKSYLPNIVHRLSQEAKEQQEK